MVPSVMVCRLLRSGNPARLCHMVLRRLSLGKRVVHEFKMEGHTHDRSAKFSDTPGFFEITKVDRIAAAVADRDP
jgi:hypothetical protein